MSPPGASGTPLSDPAYLSPRLTCAIARALPEVQSIEGLRRLSAGATLETWAFDALGGDRRWPLILRRAPGGVSAARTLSLADEAAVVRALHQTGAMVPEVVWTLLPEDDLGDGFIMVRIEGETIPRKILRDAHFDEVRPRLVAQFAQAAQRLHRIDTSLLPPALPSAGVRETLDVMTARTRSLPTPRPVFELAIRWLEDHAPTEPERPCLVHGDFRHGNVIIGVEGIRAVLDWEIAHLGDPVEDLAWLCAPPWRFGLLDKPAGGLGSREDLLEAYAQASGHAVDPGRFRYWEVMASLRWGVGCASMLEWFRSGRNRTVERAMIVRRASENEMDLMRLLAGRV
jgi:aminoglycoside phosphotransferase (APT) family kinase protein